MSGYMRSVTLKESFGYAARGVVYAISTQRNVRIHLAAAVVAAAAALALGFEPLEWALLSLTVFLVIVTEIVNTAIEKTVDMVTSEYNSLAKRAKNLAAGAVLLAAFNALAVAACLFGPRLWILVEKAL